VIVKPWGQNISLYANYIEGLQQGSTAPNGTVNAGQVFPPFKSKQYETGVKVDFGRLMATLSLFQIKQPSGITDPATQIYSIDGEQRNRGLEINTSGEVADGVRLLGGVMFIDGELTKTQGGTNDGKTAPGVPHTQVNFGTEWDTPFMRRLTLSGRVIYTSSQYLDVANTQQIPDWATFDIGARYRFEAGGKPITLRANVENLFDHSYWAMANPTYGLSPGAPRTLLLSATVDF
jgi:iron complex outermembrane receptor protein